MSKEKKNMVVPELRFPGFKDSWTFLNGDELFEQISDKNHNSDLPILAITQEHGAIPRDKIDYNVSVTDKSIESYKVVQVGDFIISLRSFQGGIEYSEFKGLCSPAYIILRKKNEKEVVNEFFKHYFKTKPFIRDLNKNLEGIRDGKMVSYKQFSDIKSPYPNPQEQQKIASCLSSLDDLITAHTQKLTALKAYKKGLMQQLFPAEGEKVPKLRFEEFKNEPKWEKKEFNKVFERLIKRNAENNQNVLTISAQDGLISQLDYFNKSIASRDLTGYYVLEKGDFAYNKSYSQGYPMGAIKALNKYDKGVVSSLYICFRILSLEDVIFFEHYFDSGIFNSEINEIAQEGARNHGLLNMSVTDFFEKTNLLIPENRKERIKIANCLSSLDDVINAQKEKVEHLKKHKSGLMQGLFPEVKENK